MSVKRYKKPVSITHPALLDEWDFDKNFSVSTEEVTAGSNRVVWWVCKECGYNWEATLGNRSRGSGCPSCSGKVTNIKNSLAIRYPKLSEEWDFYKNGNLSPDNISYGSARKVWWCCKECLFSWEASPNSRTSYKDGTGCPACAGRAVTETNKLSANCRNVSEEWCYDLNVKGPERYTTTSNKKVWWECKKCGEVWKASIYNRVKNNSGCPYCSGHLVSDNNRLSIKYSEVCKSWCYELNDKRPSEFSYNSHRRVWWKCPECDNVWKVQIYARTVGGNGCSVCSTWGVSKVSQEWLDSLNISNKYREYNIKGLNIRVDGYDPTTNTVYEFLGDYWHGNPEIYEPKKDNPTIKKSYGYLYKCTQERLESLEDLGYNVVYIWESDYRNMESIND